MTNNSFKNKLYVIIFESDTPAGKGFDLLLIVSILLSVIVVLLDSVQYYNNRYGEILLPKWTVTSDPLQYSTEVGSISDNDLYGAP